MIQFLFSPFRIVSHFVVHQRDSPNKSPLPPVLMSLLQNSYNANVAAVGDSPVFLFLHRQRVFFIYYYRLCHFSKGRTTQLRGWGGGLMKRRTSLTVETSSDDHSFRIVATFAMQVGNYLNGTCKKKTSNKRVSSIIIPPPPPTRHSTNTFSSEPSLLTRF